MLGDMGATVIKLESPHGMGDINRPVGPQRNDLGVYMHNVSCLRVGEGEVGNVSEGENVGDMAFRFQER
jgi:hypothetical protein